jgi:NADH-quinone oxidoreductase subunit E
MAAGVEAIVARFDGDKGQLVSILQDIQEEHGYLPREALEKVSRMLDIPLSQIYSVATFFRAFSLEPRGRHLIKVCLGTACHVRGANRILERAALDLSVEPGQTTADMSFTLETVNCVGCCALGPVVVVDDTTHGQMTIDKVVPMLERYRQQ